mgnify:CR=1 FL=1
MKTILALVATKDENLEKTFRKIFSDVRVSGSRKVIINVISDDPFHKIVDHVREAILDNIDIGYELFVWKKDEISKIVEKSDNVDGLLLYCDPENRSIIEKVYSQLPNKAKANLIKDNCRNPT